MDKLFIEDYEFLTSKEGSAKFVFSTAKGDLNFNKNTVDSIKNIEKLKEWFNLESVGYLNQVHGDSIFEYDGIVHDGDALITDRKNTAIGIFTADCVPILLYERGKGIIAVVHSGWKGTYLKITEKTVNRMVELYGADLQNITIYIGPHNRGCCYEVGEEVYKMFSEDPLYKDADIYNQGKLNLESCIIRQLVSAGIPKDNIKSTEICTYCSEEYELYSYRKNNLNYGRMYSFIYM